MKDSQAVSVIAVWVGWVDSEMECDDGVATGCIGQGECRRGGAFGVGDAVNPDEAFAGGMDIGICCRFPDSQIERDNGIAPRRIGQGEYRCTGALGIGDAVDPGKTVATSVIHVGVSRCSSDGQVERNDRVATSGVDECDGRRIGALGVSDTVNPSEAVASVVNICVCRRLADSKMKRDDGVAPRSIDECDGWRIGALGVSNAVNPGKAVAGIVDVGESSGLFDGQV